MPTEIVYLQDAHEKKITAIKQSLKEYIHGNPELSMFCILLPTPQDADVIGIDISTLMIDYATARASVLPTKNICFEVKDALNSLHFPFEEDEYDFINLSFASSWVPTVAAWKQLLEQCFSMALRGGVVAVTESEMALTNSKALNRLQTIILAAFQASGRALSPGSSFGVVTHLGRTLRAAGFQKVAVEVNPFDFSYSNQMENMAWRDTIPILVYETKLT